MTALAGGTLRLRLGSKARANAGHPWIYGEECTTEGKLEDGQAVVARGAKDELLGTGFYRSGAQVVWRRFRKDIGAFDTDWISQTLKKAFELRGDRPARRLCWAEADEMPGLVLDQYGKYFVAQITTAGMEKEWPAVRAEIEKVLRPEGIWVRRDSAGRKMEGLEKQEGEAFGKVPLEPIQVEIAGLTVAVNLRGGQKTGTYLDQQENYGKVARFASGKKVLDLFCHNGGFALRAAQAGALQVTAVEQSASSLELARQAGAENGLKVRWVEDDVFRHLRAARKERYDLIILDPPGMVRGRDGVVAGQRALHELHRQAIRLLAAGGLLVTFSCSHRVGRRELCEVMNRASEEAGRRWQLKENLGQASDHPVVPSFPESEYLTGMMVEVG